MVITGPDLTRGAPRSPRVRLGGFVILPRLLDKGRATIAGKCGEYQFNCPMDQRFFDFAGVAANALMNQLATGKSDGLILAWIRKASGKPRLAGEVAAWSAFESERAPMEVEARKFFTALHERVAPLRDDVVSWFDLLDVDDYVSFGGRA